MKVVILGGSGLLGQHTAAELVRRGHSVRLVGRQSCLDWLPGLGDDHHDQRVLDVWSADGPQLLGVFEGADACV
ncbi:NAD-dependent epimerase/dehydratase family protein [Aestuariimicrobium ganziense]|uniref:hypothetical protein n=1 Tax=Aestuariimicrobium ganziense TaxID=2773677 RepID=UPI001943D262|nr:hypothetical protein [Aestuariimicrobium ganziense]